MKRIIIFFILIQTDIYSQNLDSALTNLYVQTLNGYFSQQLTASKQAKLDSTMIVIYPERIYVNMLPTTIGRNKIVYYPNGKEVESILKKPYNDNKGKFIYYISHGPYTDEPGMFEVYINKYVVTKYTKRESIDIQKYEDNTIKFTGSIGAYNYFTKSWTVKMKTK